MTSRRLTRVQQLTINRMKSGWELFVSFGGDYLTTPSGIKHHLRRVTVSALAGRNLIRPKVEAECYGVWVLA